MDLVTSALRIEIQGEEEVHVSLKSPKGVTVEGYMTVLPIPDPDWRERIWRLYRPSFHFRDDQESHLPGSLSIHTIRKYFGEKVSLYYAWLSCFTYSLLIPSIVGGSLWSFSSFYGIDFDDNVLLPGEEREVDGEREKERKGGEVFDCA